MEQVSLLEEPEPHECPNGDPAVLGADLLALGDAARLVADGYLMNPVAELAHFGGDLGTELKAFATQRDGRNNFTTKGFVGSGLVRDVGAVQEVGETTQHHIAEPVAPHHLGANAAGESRSVYYLHRGIVEASDDLQVVARVVFHIAILNGDDVTCDVFQADPNRRAFAEVQLRKVYDDFWIILELLQQPRRCVERAVVDDDDLFLQRQFLQPLNYFQNIPLFVVYRDNERSLHLSMTLTAIARWQAELRSASVRPQ